MNNSILKLFIITLLIGVYGCEKPKKASPIPLITYVDAVVTEEALRIKIHFVDGNGDLGMTSDEAPYDCQGDPSILCPNLDYYNLFFKYYEFENGEWILPDPQPSLYYRFDDISSSGQDQYLEGNLTNKINFPINSTSASKDSIKFEMWITDRALNPSNVVESPLIVIP